MSKEIKSMAELEEAITKYLETDEELPLDNKDDLYWCSKSKLLGLIGEFKAYLIKRIEEYSKLCKKNEDNDEEFFLYYEGIELELRRLLDGI